LGKDMVPKRLFFTKGVGKHKERLTSFELALRDAGIAAQNLVRVSSIFPPNCKLITRKEGLKYLNPGEVVFAVVAENSTREPHRLVVSSIGVAIPTDKNTYGYLSEHHSFGETEEQAGDYAEELAAEMLATTLDMEFDPDKSWDEKKEIYRMSDKIVRTANVTQSAVGDKNGRWTTTIAAARKTTPPAIGSAIRVAEGTRMASPPIAFTRVAITSSLLRRPSHARRRPP
jgi:arginine decarboxylase